MLRFLTLMLFSLAFPLASANDFEDADKAWAPGKPWPSHWGLVQYPYKDGWNVVMVGFVNKVYGEGEAASTWLKDIPSAMSKGASVEVCMAKRGLLEIASLCKPAVVDPELVGALQENDVIAFLYPSHGTKLFSRGPGSDPRTTLRVFQKISAASDKTCWVREMMVFTIPRADVCFKKVDPDLVGRILTRDFGPREGVAPIGSLTTSPVIDVKIEPTPSKPELDAPTQPGTSADSDATDATDALSEPKPSVIENRS